MPLATRRGETSYAYKEERMKVTIQLVIESESGAPPVVQEVAQIERAALHPDTVGLHLDEAKDMLQHIQRAMVEHQVAAYLAQQDVCPDCGQQRHRKGAHSIVLRTVFGTLRLPSPRLVHCPCQPQRTQTFSPLVAALPERTTPELLYLETKFAALMSYGLSVKVLEEVLPLGRPLSREAVRVHTHQVAERMEQELGEEQWSFIEGCPQAWAELPRPDLPLTVGIDGGYVHSAAQTSRRDGWFEIIVGKSVPAEGAAKCFGFVQSYDTKPKRRLVEVLKGQGMQMNQQVTFLTDGGDDVRELPLYLNPQAEHLLDWFHLAMRVTVMRQYTKGLHPTDGVAPAVANADLERIKWLLWHGNVYRALQEIEALIWRLEGIEEPSPSGRKLAKGLTEFETYVRNNRGSIPNYGERWRNGETISTAFAESTVDQVLSKRMVKKQQMRWTPHGAHLLLQVRTRELNGELRDTFCGWYAGMGEATAHMLAA
jgi:hypothetical protein